MANILLMLYKAIELYTWVLIARILLTWLPSIDWYKQPFRFLAEITDPLLSVFRGIIPPLGGMDLSPILLFVALNIVQGILASIINSSMTPVY